MTTGVSQINLGDIITTLVMLGVIVIPIVIAILFYMAYKKNSKRQSFEQQQTLILKKQVEDLQKRVDELEK